jgi:hypothetical protein
VDDELVWMPPAPQRKLTAEWEPRTSVEQLTARECEIFRNVELD